MKSILLISLLAPMGHDRVLQPDGSMTKEVTEDFTHLTAKGYEIFAGAIQPALESLLRKP